MEELVKPKLDQQKVSGWLDLGFKVWIKLDENGNPIPGTICPYDEPPENIDDYFEYTVV